MARGDRKPNLVEARVSNIRWLAYLVTVSGFVFIWLVDPVRMSIPLLSPPVLLLLGLAIVYIATISVLISASWLARVLPIASIVIDILFALVGYYLLSPYVDLLNPATDPLIILALFPIVTITMRFSWKVGVAVGFVVGLLRTGLLIWGLPVPYEGDVLLYASLAVLVLPIISFLSGYLGETILRPEYVRRRQTGQDEIEKMRTDLRQAEALQQMTGTLGDTLSFERVIESALDVATSTMAEWDPQGSQVGMVFLFQDGGRMRLAAARNLPRYESGQGIAGQEGIVARCLEAAEIVVRRSPLHDPELQAYTGISNCLVAAAVPLRAGLENYGAMVFATSAFDMYTQEQLDLFSALASRAALALSNALLYENLQIEKDRIVAIENEAKRRLSRDLHDGPTQSVSAIAMRLNFMRKALVDKPERLTEEIELVEQLALQTVSEIRHMLFTLRPLVLETQGLVPALRALVEKTQQMAPLNIRIREMGDAAKYLDSNQAGVIFHVVEEALGNARKYSEAKLIEIRLWTEDNLFVTQVADNGVGFDVGEVLGNYESRGSLGMVNMRERAALIDGSLDVQSMPGKGTKITLVVPLARRVV